MVKGVGCGVGMVGPVEKPGCNGADVRMGGYAINGRLVRRDIAG
jgi:hypothetical protein